MLPKLIRAQVDPVIWNLDSLKTPTCLRNPNGLFYFQVKADSGNATLFVKSIYGTVKREEAPYTIQNLRPTNYQAWVYYGKLNWYSDTLQVTLSDSLLLTSSVSILNLPSCFNDSTFSFKVNASGGVPPYRYHLYNFPNIFTQYQVSDTFQHIKFSNYYVYTNDNKNCDHIIQIPDSLFIPLRISPKSIKKVSCNGKSDGVIEMQISGGIKPYQIQWLNFPGYSQYSKSNLAKGWYNFAVIDSINCVHENGVSLPVRYISNKIQFCNAQQKPGSKHVELTWYTNDLEAAEKILLYRSRYFNGSEVLVNSLSPYDTMQYTDTSVLAADGPWYYGLKVVDSCGNQSGFSSTTRAALGTATRISDGVKLSWIPYLGRAGDWQEIICRTNQGNWKNIGKVSPFITEWKDTTPFSSGLREYFISWKFKQICNDTFQENNSMSNMMTIEFPLSLFQNQEKITVKLFPNPVDNVLQLLLETKYEELEYAIYNSHGQLIEQAPLDSKGTIETAKFSTGVYYIKLKNQQGYLITKQFLIIH